MCEGITQVFVVLCNKSGGDGWIDRAPLLSRVCTSMHVCIFVSNLDQRLIQIGDPRCIKNRAVDDHRVLLHGSLFQCVLIPLRSDVNLWPRRGWLDWESARVHMGVYVSVCARACEPWGLAGPRRLGLLVSCPEFGLCVCSCKHNSRWLGRTPSRSSP